MKKGMVRYSHYAPDAPAIKFHVRNSYAILRFDNNDEMRDAMKSWIDNPNLQFIEAEDSSGYQVFINWKAVDSFEPTWRYS